jgi:hypothetical protein
MFLSLFLAFTMHLMGLSAHATMRTPIAHGPSATGTATNHHPRMHAYDAGGTAPV